MNDGIVGAISSLERNGKRTRTDDMNDGIASKWPLSEVHRHFQIGFSLAFGHPVSTHRSRPLLSLE
jgi:hypothetical protein